MRLVEQTTQPWEFWFGLLERYVTERGTAWVPGKEIFNGHRLGQWVIVQRTKWEALSHDRRQRSSACGWDDECPRVSMGGVVQSPRRSCD